MLICTFFPMHLQVQHTLVKPQTKAFKMNQIQIPFPGVLTLFLAFSLMTCHTSKNNQTNCQYLGTVKDYSQLDGCTFLIEMDNGTLLMPVETTIDGFSLKKDMRIAFSYEEVPDMMSICMTGDQIVRLTCVKESESPIPVLPECHDVNSPMEVPWMKEAVTKHRAEQVVKYRYRTNGWAYLYKGERNFMYDCQGTLICETKDGNYAPCVEKADAGFRKNGQVIWQGEGVRE